MNEQSSKKSTPKKDKSTRPLYDIVEGIQQAKEESRARHSNKGQSQYRAWGPLWLKLLVLAMTSFFGFLTFVVDFGQWRTDQIDTVAAWQKDRARIAISTPQDLRIESGSDLSFSLIFKNMGATAALNPYGVALNGECKYASSEACIRWCLEPLPDTQGESYDPLDYQDTHTEDFSYTLKAGRARKKQRPIYFCGYFAYTDVFCVRYRKFYVLSYDSSTNLLTTHTLRKEEKAEAAQNCHP